MKQMLIVGHGGPEKLQPRESPDPSPAAGEIRIRVKASGINFADILARQGLYPDSPKIPCVVGYEVSGLVDAVGAGVHHSWVGRDVFALTRFGGYSDVVVVPEKQGFAKPASLSYEQAAAIPVNYLTAWQLLVVMGSLKHDETDGRLGMFGISVATTSKLVGPLRLVPVALGMPLFHPLFLMNTNKSVFGVNLGHMWHETDMIAAWMEILLKGVADGWVRPHVDKSFPLAQAGEAQTYMEQRKNTGKVVLTT